MKANYNHLEINLSTFQQPIIKICRFEIKRILTGQSSDYTPAWDYYFPFIAKDFINARVVNTQNLTDGNVSPELRSKCKEANTNDNPIIILVNLN